MSEDLRTAAATLREFALGFPEAYEDHPWGESVAKVNKKVFVFFGVEAEEMDVLRLSVKLPHSVEEALGFPFTQPTGYGLGKSGWVTATVPACELVPLDILRDWIEESYRAVAPKKLVAQLDAR
jgi:predicted DNA-binding protein (MmcQ/YjbR family)